MEPESYFRKNEVCDRMVLLLMKRAAAAKHDNEREVLIETALNYIRDNLGDST